jgi:hypothetical protein
MTDHQSALPSSLEVEQHGHVAVLRLRREHKRNAIDDVTVLGIEQFFSNLPPDARCVILDAAGDNFSAGLDLSSFSETSTFDGLAHSAMWHRSFQKIEFGPAPVIAVLKGAVVGGLELATTAPRWPLRAGRSTHVIGTGRVAPGQGVERRAFGHADVVKRGKRIAFEYETSPTTGFDHSSTPADSSRTTQLGPSRQAPTPQTQRPILAA